MSITKLPVNFKDDVIDTSVSDKRRYNLITNSDGTTSLEDVTTYEQIGSSFGAEQVNQTNGKVNELIDESVAVREDFNTLSTEVNEVVKKDFVLVNQSVLNFENNVAVINDERITGDSLADVYFTQETFNVAERAVISVETFAGKVKLTAGRTPEGTIIATITIKVV